MQSRYTLGKCNQGIKFPLFSSYFSKTFSKHFHCRNYIVQDLSYNKSKQKMRMDRTHEIIKITSQFYLPMRQNNMSTTINAIQSQSVTSGESGAILILKKKMAEAVNKSLSWIYFIINSSVIFIKNYTTYSGGANKTTQPHE